MKNLFLFTCFAFVLFACGTGSSTQESADSKPGDTTTAATTDTQPSSEESPNETVATDPDSTPLADLDDYREEDFGEGEEEETPVDEEDPWETPTQERYYTGTFNDDNANPLTVTLQEYGGGLVMGFYRRHDQKEWTRVTGNVDSAKKTIQLKAYKSVNYKSVTVATLDGVLKGNDLAGKWSDVEGTNFPFAFKFLAPSKIAHRFKVETTGSPMENTDVVVNSISIYDSEENLIQTLKGFESKRQDGANRGLFVKDVNFDGYPDLCQWGNDFNCNIWVYNKESGEYSFVPESVGMSEPIVDYQAKQIIATEVLRRGYHFLDRYIFKDGHFFRVESTEHSNKEDEVIATKRYEIVDGRSVEVKN